MSCSVTVGETRRLFVCACLPLLGPLQPHPLVPSPPPVMELFMILSEARALSVLPVEGEPELTLCKQHHCCEGESLT